MPARITTEEYIERAKSIHNNNYVYDRTEYVNMQTPVTITCKCHGDFQMLPKNHLI